MAITGIEQLTFAVDNLDNCRQFALDWGLKLVDNGADELVFETLNGCRVVVAGPGKTGLPEGIEANPSIREVIWAAESAEDVTAIGAKMAQEPNYSQTDAHVGCTDPNGVAVRVRISSKRDVNLTCAVTNTWNERKRVNQPSPAYERAYPVEVGHVVFFVADLIAATRFYEDVLGFVISDRYPGRGHFFRCAPEGGHHDLFLLQTPEGKRGVNHVAFTVRDVHEVIGGGMHMSRCGWKTQLGPGRHPVSSALFWYVESPLGALWEYYTDEDELTETWSPRDFTPGPTVFAEWAIKGGIDGHTRRQVNVDSPNQQFLTNQPNKE